MHYKFKTCTKHISFMISQVDKDKMSVQYWKTEHIIEYYFINPLQGTFFYMFSKSIMGSKNISTVGHSIHA